MAWEPRNGRGSYYTRSKRLNGRVVREYVGTGLVGEMAAAEDAERRSDREERRALRSARRKDLENVDALVGRCWEGASGLATAVLVDSGFYRHHRGEWRKRRVS